MGSAAPPSGQLATRVEGICAQPLAAKAMREKIVAAVGRRIRFDAYNFPLTDPLTRVATSPLADVPMLPWARLPELIRLRYLTKICRWDEVTASGHTVTSLARETAGQPERSALWRGIQQGLGVSDTAIAVFVDRYGCWGALDLWRTDGSVFEPADLAQLEALIAPVTAGLRRSVARTFVDPDEQLLPPGPAVVVLGPDLKVRSQTHAAATALLQLNPPDEPIAPIPAAAYNIAAALVAEENGVAIGPVWSRVHLGGCRWVTVKASRLDRDIGVAIEPSTAAERMDIYARASGLSERESEILALLGQGLDTRQIAERIVVSEHTAADHVKAVLGKAGVRSRQMLLARVIGAT